MGKRLRGLKKSILRKKRSPQPSVQESADSPPVPKSGYARLLKRSIEQEMRKQGYSDKFYDVSVSEDLQSFSFVHKDKLVRDRIHIRDVTPQMKARAQKLSATHSRLAAALREKLGAKAAGKKLSISPNGRSYRLVGADGSQSKKKRIPRTLRLAVRNDGRVKRAFLRKQYNASGSSSEPAKEAQQIAVGQDEYELLLRETQPSGHVSHKSLGAPMTAKGREFSRRALALAKITALQEINKIRRQDSKHALEELPSNVEVVFNKAGTTFTAQTRVGKKVKPLFHGDLRADGSVEWSTTEATERRARSAKTYASWAVEDALAKELGRQVVIQPWNVQKSVRLNKSQNGFEVRINGIEGLPDARFTGTLNASGEVSSLKRHRGAQR
jgi:hypothetical protein